MSETNIEEFLKAKGFELESCYKENKRYRKNISRRHRLYVRIYSDSNSLEDVQYEEESIRKNGDDPIVRLLNINTFYKLKELLQILD